MACFLATMSQQTKKVSAQGHKRFWFNANWGRFLWIRLHFFRKETDTFFIVSFVCYDFAARIQVNFSFIFLLHTLYNLYISSIFLLSFHSSSTYFFSLLFLFFFLRLLRKQSYWVNILKNNITIVYNYNYSVQYCMKK